MCMPAPLCFFHACVSDHGARKIDSIDVARVIKLNFSSECLDRFSSLVALFRVWSRFIRAGLYSFHVVEYFNYCVTI